MSKRTFKLIYKGILLYITIIAIMLFICSVDSLSDRDLFIGITIVISLIYACRKAKYSAREITILSGNKILKRFGFVV